jgi:hypothetical protein
MEVASIDVREEIDMISIDPLFVERQRNRYSSRALGYLVWLNGLAAIALLIGLPHANLPADESKRLADAMLLFGAGSLCGLASAFFAYVGRTFRLERPNLITWRRPLRWLAILAAIAGAICFVAALNMARMAYSSQEAVSAPRPASAPANQPSAPSTLNR